MNIIHKVTKLLLQIIINLFGSNYLIKGTWGNVVVKALRYAASRKVPGSIPGRVTGDFFRSNRQVHVPGVDSASKNEY
jgi:hypothetical protein